MAETKKTTKKPAAKKATTKPAAKKRTAKAAAPKKSAAAKPAAKKTTAKKASAKAAAPKKTTAKKAAAPKKATAKKATAKKPKAAEAPAVAVPVDPQQRRRDAARELAKLVASAGLDKKADRIEIIDIGDKVDYADYLVLMSGRSDRQVQAIAGGIEESLKQRGERPRSVEGVAQGHWVIVDYGDVIVHVFQEEARRYYDLDSLWLDARRVPFETGARPSIPPPA